MSNPTLSHAVALPYIGDPGDDPNVFTLEQIAVAISVDSAVVSSTTSQVVSTAASGALDSVPVSTADSKAVSAASRASVADSKAVSVSGNTSVADSKALSGSVNTSVADSKATSVGAAATTLAAVTSSENISRADSKAVSVASYSQPLPSGRTVTTLTTYIANNAVFNVKDFGATGDGVTDDTTAILATITAAVGGALRIPAGTYVFSSHLNFSGVELIVGDGRVNTTLKPTVAVTSTAVTIDTDCSASGFTIDGTSTGTGNVVGLKLGNDTLATKIRLDDVGVTTFRGTTSGRCVSIGNLVELKAINCFFAKGGNACVYIAPADGSYPTVCTFEQTQFREATQKGLRLASGFSIRFLAGCVFESNGEEGAYVVPGEGLNALDISFEKCWFENNGGDYHLKADGTSASATCRVVVRDTYFNIGAAGIKAIHFNAVSDFVLDNTTLGVANRAGAILLEGNGTGTIVNWPGRGNGTTGTVITDSLAQGVYTEGRVAAAEAAWAAWTPTLTANGGGSFAVTGTAQYRYLKFGKMLFFSIYVKGTVTGAVNSIDITLPDDLEPIFTDGYPVGCVVFDGDGGSAPSFLRMIAATNTINFVRASAAAFGTSAGLTGLNVTGVMEVA